MTRRSQRYRSTTLPFSYRDSGIQFDLNTYSVDQEDPVDLDLKPGQTEINLASTLGATDQEMDEWQYVTLSGQLRISEETVDAVFPQDERDIPPAKLYVTVRCHETIYRNREVVSQAPTRPDTYNISIRLKKEDIRETVELRPYLVRTKERDIQGEYATQKNFRVASGKIYTVVVDQPLDEEPPAIDGERVSFSQSNHLPGGSKLYYLDFRNESRPKLWINSDHPRITEVLQSRGSVGAEARMRDVILDQISYGVWMQLLVRASSAIDRNGDVAYDWQQAVLETFARNLYEVNDLEEATHRLRNDIGNAKTLPHVMQRIDDELQEYIDPRTQLINLMEEGLQI